MLDKNALYISIILYLVIAIGLLYYKPSFLFADKDKKRLKIFGTGKNKNKSIFPLWFVLFIIGIIIYFLVSCIINKTKIKESIIV